jgi:hypothetical protein
LIQQCEIDADRTGHRAGRGQDLVRRGGEPISGAAAHTIDEGEDVLLLRERGDAARGLGDAVDRAARTIDLDENVLDRVIRSHATDGAVDVVEIASVEAHSVPGGEVFVDRAVDVDDGRGSIYLQNIVRPLVGADGIHLLSPKARLFFGQVGKLRRRAVHVGEEHALKAGPDAGLEEQRRAEEFRE